MRLGHVVVVAALWLGCPEDEKGFGPPDAPRPIVLKTPPRTPAPATPPPSPTLPPPVAPLPATAREGRMRPTTRAAVLELFRQYRGDPFCGTGDPWVSFTGQTHPKEVLLLLAEWARDPAAEDRAVAVRALAGQEAPSLLETWRALAAEPSPPFPETTARGLLQTGGDGEVPLALSVLSKDPTLAFIVRGSPSDATAAHLLARLDLHWKLTPPPFEQALRTVDTESAWTVLTRAEPQLRACFRLGPADESGPVAVGLDVDEKGRTVAATIASIADVPPPSQRLRKCIEAEVKRLKFAPPGLTANGFMVREKPSVAKLRFVLGPGGVS